MDYTYNIKLRVENSQATSAMTGVKQSLGNISSSSEDANKSIAQMNKSLNSIKPTSLASLATTLTNSSKRIKEFYDSINKYKISENIGKDLVDFAKEAGSLFKAFQKTIPEEGLFTNFRMSFSPDTNEIMTKWHDNLIDKCQAIKAGWTGIANEIKNSCIPAIVFFLKYVLILKGAISFIKNAISVASTGDQIKDNAQKVGMTATAYQEWGYVLKQNNIEITSLKTSIRTFSKLVASGDSSLKKYGITATTTSEAFAQAVKNIQNMTSETDKLNAVYDLFGNRASEMLPLFNMTNQQTERLMETYRAIGGTMSDQLIKKSDTLTDSITAMKSAWQGLRNTLAELIMPFLTTIVQKLMIVFAYVNIVIRTLFGIESSFNAATTSSSGITDNLDSANASATKLKKTIMGFDELNVLNSNDNSSSSSSGSVDFSDADTTANSITFSDEVLEKIDKFKAKVEELQTPIRIVAGLLAAWIIAPKLFSGLETLATLLFSLPSLINGASFAGPLAGVVKLVGKLTVVVGLATTIYGVIDMIKNGVNEVNAMITIVGTTLTGIGVAILAGASILTGGLIGLIVGAVAVIGIAIYQHWDEIKAGLKDLWEGLKQVPGNFVALIQSEFGSVIQDLKDFGTSIKNWFNKLLTTLKTAFTKFINGLPTAMKKILNTVIGLVEKMINNSILGGAYKLGSTVVNKIFGTNLPKSISLPRLANGGVLTTPTVAMLGEYSGAKSNPEIATPQNLLMEIINDGNAGIVNAFAQMTQQVIAAIEDNQMTVSIGDDVIARSAQRGNQSYKNRTGRSLITA